MIQCSVCKAVSTEDASDAGLSGKKKILRKAKPLVADGISLEAFKLSDQANTLYEKGILPLVKKRSEKPATTSSSFSSFSSKTNVMKSIAQKALNKGGGKGNEKGEEEHVDKIELDGEVLIQSTEVTSVDPFLFAVPLPIQSLNNKSAKKAAGDAKRKTIQPTAKTSAGDRVTIGTEDEGFEHSFPSECEMQNNENTAKVAKLHFNQILLGISNPGTKSRMKDPHLLHYLSKMLDANTRDALCRSLSDGTDRFPGLVKVALDMVKMSLDTSRSDSSNSVGRRSGRFIPDDDDDDDDE